MVSQLPSFAFEEQYWQQGIMHVAGIDEVGMGALAGPVVAAAVIFPSTIAIEGLRDSKKLSAKQRAELVPIIQEKALAFNVGEASVEEIFSINIRRASHLAMRRAVEGLTTLPDILLIDGNPAQIHDRIPSQNIIRGDNVCCSIAAASILAKVHRDAIMKQLHDAFPTYNFAGNKGYGSATHLAALKEIGATLHHRAAYAPVTAALQSHEKIDKN